MTLQGADLLIALHRTEHMVMLLVAGAVAETLSAEQAAATVALEPDRWSGRCQGAGRRRVKTIQRLSLSAAEPNTGPWSKCTAGHVAPGCGECVGCRRAALPVSREWALEMGYR